MLVFCFLFSFFLGGGGLATHTPADEQESFPLISVKAIFGLLSWENRMCSVINLCLNLHVFFPLLLLLSFFWSAKITLLSCHKGMIIMIIVTSVYHEMHDLKYLKCIIRSCFHENLMNQMIIDLKMINMNLDWNMLWKIILRFEGFWHFKLPILRETEWWSQKWFIWKKIDSKSPK